MNNMPTAMEAKIHIEAEIKTIGRLRFSVIDVLPAPYISKEYGVRKYKPFIMKATPLRHPRKAMATGNAKECNISDNKFCTAVIAITEISIARILLQNNVGMLSGIPRIFPVAIYITTSHIIHSEDTKEVAAHLSLNNLKGDVTDKMRFQLLPRCSILH